MVAAAWLDQSSLLVYDHELRAVVAYALGHGTVDVGLRGVGIEVQLAGDVVVAQPCSDQDHLSVHGSSDS